MNFVPTLRTGGLQLDAGDATLCSGAVSHRRFAFIERRLASLAAQEAVFDRETGSIAEEPALTRAILTGSHGPRATRPARAFDTTRAGVQHEEG